MVQQLDLVAQACPLTPALITLLEAAVLLRTTNNKSLSEYLSVSEEAVKSGFRRIGQLLDTHSRSEALLHALLSGWISPKPMIIPCQRGTLSFYAERGHCGEVSENVAH